MNTEKLPEVKIYSKWINKHNYTYTVIALANEDATEENKEKYPIQVIHRGENGKIWCRPLSDWHRSFKPLEKEKVKVSEDNNKYKFYNVEPYKNIENSFPNDAIHPTSESVMKAKNSYIAYLINLLIVLLKQKPLLKEIEQIIYDCIEDRTLNISDELKTKKYEIISSNIIFYNFKNKVTTIKL